ICSEISVMSALNVQLFGGVGKRNCMRALDLMLRREIRLLGLAAFFQALPEPQGVKTRQVQQGQEGCNKQAAHDGDRHRPQKAERDSGIMVRIAASAVSTTGRARRTVASTMASLRVRPWETSASI